MTRYEHATVHLNGVHLYGYHGMSEEERQVGNHFCIHVGMLNLNDITFNKYPILIFC